VPDDATGGVLELAFSTQDLRTLCEGQADADRRFGEACGSALRQRLADLRAAANTAEFLELVGGRARQDATRRQVEIELVNGTVMTIGPNHVKTPLGASRDVDWSQVSRVKILRLWRRDA
jgi:hypothetical protein